MSRHRRRKSKLIEPVYVPPAPLEVVRRVVKQRYHLRADLIIVDVILQRWAVSIGDGLPAEEWDERVGSVSVPLDDERAILVDQLVLHSPEMVKSIVKHWYKTPIPVRAIAASLQISTASVVSRWCGSLEWLKPHMVERRVIDYATQIAS